MSKIIGFLPVVNTYVRVFDLGPLLVPLLTLGMFNSLTFRLLP